MCTQYLAVTCPMVSTNYLMSAFTKWHVILRYVYTVCMCVYRYMYIQGRGKRSGYPSFGWTVFCQGESRISFIQKAGNGQSDSIMIGLAGIIILCYNRWKRHIKRCKIMSAYTLCLQDIRLCEKLSNNRVAV